MPYYQATRSDRIDLPSDPTGHYYVMMKRRAQHGDQSAAQSAALITRTLPIDDPEVLEKRKFVRHMDRESGTAMIIEFDNGAMQAALLRRLIVEWNLDDESGRVLPITDETIAALLPEDGDYLTKEAWKRLGRRPSQQEGPFERPSEPSSTEGTPATLSLPNDTPNTSSAVTSGGPPTS